MSPEKPIRKDVLDVIRRSATDDPAAVKQHQAMSRRGGLAAAESKRRKKLDIEVKEAENETKLQEAALEQAKLLSFSPDGEVLPPDPDIIATFKK